MIAELLLLLFAQPPAPPSFEPVFRQAVALRLKQYGPKHIKYADSLVSLALFLRRQDAESKEPQRLLEQALAIAQPVSLQKTAEILEHLGDITGEPSRYEGALAIREKESASDLEPLLTKLGDARGSAGRHAEAETLYRRAVTILEKQSPPDWRRLANAYNNVAVTLEAQQKLAAAEPYYARAVASFEKALGASHPEVGSTLVNLAEAVRQRGDAVAAEPLLRRAIGILENTVGPRHPRVADAYEGLAAVMDAQGDAAKAREYRNRSSAIRK